MIFLIFNLLLFTNCLTENLNQCEEVKRYLYEYGYLQEEYYKLPVDGKLNNETRNFMFKPRCGNVDIISDFRVSTYKWNKTTLTWHYYLANNDVLELTRKAFSLWEQNSGIRFIHDRMNPDILISNKRLKHMMQNQSSQCVRIFDGKRGTLAHSFLPNYDNSQREIHIDDDENWSYSMYKNESADQLLLFSTLIHEIGHAIGISHTDVTESVMFAYYNGKTELGSDDILAVQNLYGKPQTISTPPPPPSSSPSPPLIEEDASADNNQIDLCHLKNINTLLIAKNRLYILYDKWLWIINLNDMMYSDPVIITDWLTFLPKKFTKVSAVYQRPSGEIVMVIDSFIYMFDLMSLQLIYGYPKQVSSTFNVQPNKLHTVFNSYTGKTFIFHDDNYYRVIDECTSTATAWGYISDAFPGIPPKVDSSFRFIDGNLYFFKNDSVFVFNEFTGQLLKAERNNLSLFGLRCANEDLLNKLQEILSQLLTKRKKY